MVARMTALALALAWTAAAQETFKLERRADGLWYTRGAATPFTGTNRVLLLDGTKRSETVCRAGRRHGLARAWYGNGKLKSSFPFANGKADGNATYYYRSGTLQTFALYRAGKQHGRSVDYWPDGKTSFEENYTDGVADGIWRSWWPSGKISSVKIYRNRRLKSHREWTKDGTPRQLPGWNLDGTVKTAASAAKARAAIGRRISWSYGSGNNRIDLIYRGKTLTTLRKVFGDPDESDDRRWIFKGLRIQDPVNGDSFDTAIFRYKDGKVTEIRIE